MASHLTENESSVNKRKFSDSEETNMCDGSVLRFHKLSESARMPTRGSKYAAGLDLYSAQEVEIPASGKKCVMTDIQIAIPEGCYARVAPRSGLAAKHHIDVGAGVIDYDYRGNVGVVMFNLGDKPFQVNVGDRIAQLVLEKIFMPTVEESAEKLPETTRGAGGFGSTGGFQPQTNGSHQNGSHQNGNDKNGSGEPKVPKMD